MAIQQINMQFWILTSKIFYCVYLERISDVWAKCSEWTRNEWKYRQQCLCFNFWISPKHRWHTIYICPSVSYAPNTTVSWEKKNLQNLHPKRTWYHWKQSWTWPDLSSVTLVRWWGICNSLVNSVKPKPYKAADRKINQTDLVFHKLHNHSSTALQCRRRKRNDRSPRELKWIIWRKCCSGNFYWATEIKLQTVPI